MTFLRENWIAIREQKNYQGLGFDLVLAFNTLSQNLRVEVTLDDTTDCALIGYFGNKGDVPAKGLAQALKDGDIALDLDMETRIQGKAYELNYQLRHHLNHD